MINQMIDFVEISETWITPFVIFFLIFLSGVCILEACELNESFKKFLERIKKFFK